jgi:anaerobic magnesium-protoporphyrin IX monomethyl ester cyclase
MKILVCNPPGRLPENRYICPFPSRWTSMFKGYPVFIYYPYELAYLSTLLKRELPNDHVKMIDGAWMRFTAEDYKQYLDLEKPDWVIFEVDTVSYAETLKVARHARNILGAEVIMTGQYPTAWPEKVVADGFQYACVGEFEETVLDILKGKDSKSIEGLYPKSYRKVLDLDWLPDPEDEDVRRIDYSYSGGHRWTRYREIEVHPSRGCPYTCDFCVAGTVYYENINWRFRKTSRIINEIETLRRKYPEMEGCFFNEETHIIRKKDILEFCEAIVDSGNNDLRYEAMANHQRLDEEILEAIKKAGYYKLRVGIESIDEDTGQSIGLIKTRSDELEKILEIAKKLGIEMYGTFLFGASGSTPEGDRKTIEFGKSVISKGLLSSWQASIAVPHPATDFYKKAVKNGWLVTDDLDRFNGISDTVVSYPNYSREQILETTDTMRQAFEEAQPFETTTRPKSVAQEKTRMLKKDRELSDSKLDELTPLFQMEKYDQVVQGAQSILAEFPQALTSYHVMGSVHKQRGDLLSARKQFEKIVQTAYDYEDALVYAAGAHYHLGVISLEEGKTEEALRHFKNCVHLNPNHGAAWDEYWKLRQAETGSFGLEEKIYSSLFSLLSVASPLLQFWLKPKIEDLKTFSNVPLRYETVQASKEKISPKISIVIRTLNEENFLEQTLTAISKQDETSWEVILIDSGSKDKTIEIAKRFPITIVSIQQDSFHYAKALNLGARLARGEIVVNLSAHAVPENERWLGALVDPLSDSKVAGVHGAEKPLEGWSSPFERKILADTFGKHYLERTEDDFFSNANSAMRKSDLIGYPFDETVDWAEDRIWAGSMQSRGYKIVYQPRSAVFHSHNLSFQGQFQRSLKFYRVFFKTLKQDCVARKTTESKKSFMKKAAVFRRFLMDQGLSSSIYAYLYAPFFEYINHLALEMASEEIKSETKFLVEPASNLKRLKPSTGY